ncbi:MAG TPA: Na+/H+ antiporter [Candidatus Limnocylindria bacterium]|nr:Na+/H+ antiporter [Candidatus Limnocylindria bacterium]
MSEIQLILLLLSLVIVLTAVSRRAGASTPIVMVLGGLVLSFAPGLPTVTLSPELIFFGFLPPLLFAGGYFTSLRDFRANLRYIVLLAFGLVLFTAILVAIVARALVPQLGWAGAFALGGIVAPPDAIAATAIFQRLGVPRRIITILEGESLVNDATALVIYRFAVAAAAAGAFSLLDASMAFVLVLVGGMAIGMVVGWAIDQLAQRVSDVPLLTAIGLVAPYGAYLPAESLGVSGVLAVVVGGIWARHAMRHATSDARVVAASVWQIWLFLLNGLVFFLLGLQLPAVVRSVDLSSATAVAAAAIVLTVVLGRIVWVFPVTYLPKVLAARKRNEPRPTWRPVVVVAWSGLRGVVSLAAALALPVGFPERDLVLLFTFVVILATLVGQGLTLPVVIRALGLAPEEDVAHAEAHARALTAEAALTRLDEMLAESPGHKPLIDTLRTQYEHRASHAELHHNEEAGAAEQELLEHTEIRREAIAAERRAAFDLHERGVIDDQLLRRIERDLDLEDLRMEA